MQPELTEPPIASGALVPWARASIFWLLQSLDTLLRRESEGAIVINRPQTWRSAAAIVAFCASLAAGPAAADDKPAGCKITPEKVAVDTTPPINIGILANALIYYRCTDYDDQVKSVLNEARAWVAARAPGVAKPAIVLDIDETSLSTGKRFITIISATFQVVLAISTRRQRADSMTGSSALKRPRSGRRSTSSPSPKR